MKYKIEFTKQALKDLKTLKPKLRTKLRDVLLNVLSEDPLVGKKLMGDLKGNFSYRLDLKNRIVYSVEMKRRIVYLKRVRTHYGD